MGEYARKGKQGPSDERVSMWSVPRRFRRVYFPLFYLLGIIGIGWSVWYEASRIGVKGSYHDIANAVIMKAPAVLLTAAFISLVITEGTMVLAEMLREHYEKRDARKKAAIEKVMAAGREKGRQEGIAIGAERMSRKWADWNRRRLSAKERGADFDEPPPSSHDKNGVNDSENSD